MGSNSVLRFVERSHHWLYVSIMAPWSPTMSKVCRCTGCAPHFFETFHTFLRNLETICTPHFLETFGRIIWIFFWYSMKLIIYQSNAVLLRHCLMTIKYCPILYQIKKLTSICFLTITNCQVVRSRLVPHRINYKSMCLSAFWQWQLANKRARISEVIVKTRINVSNVANQRTAFVIERR